MAETVLNFRYTRNSRAARHLGNRLLELTSGYEHIRLQHDAEIPLLIEIGLVSRARHMVRATHLAADRGDDFTATLSLRALNESAMTLAWLMLDRELGSLLMRIDEVRTRLSHHQEFAKVERNKRRATRRRGDHVDPVAPGGSLGLLDRGSVRDFRKLEADLRDEARTLPKFNARMTTLGAESLNRVPSFKARAYRSGNPWLYTAAYRFDSNSAAHPTLLGLQQFVHVIGGEFVIRDSPIGPRPDPYDGAAILFGAVAQLASRCEGHPLIDKEELDRVETEVRLFDRAS